MNDDIRQKVKLVSAAEGLLGQYVRLSVEHKQEDRIETVAGRLEYAYTSSKPASITTIKIGDVVIRVDGDDEWLLDPAGMSNPRNLDVRTLEVSIDAMVLGRYDGRRPAKIVRRVSGDAWIVRYIDGFGVSHEVGRFASEIHADPEILEQMREMPFAGV